MAQLPPRVPNMAANWPQFSPSSQKKMMMSAMDPSWADDFLDFSVKRGSHSHSHSHRRSMSDSVAFLDIPLMAAEEEECRRRSSIIPGSSNGGVFEKFDDDDDEQKQQQQLMSIFTNDHQHHHMIMGSGSGSGGPNSSNPSSPSDFNNMNIDDDDDGDEKEINPSDHNLQQQQEIMKSEPEEVQSSSKSDQLQMLAAAHNGIMDYTSNDKIIDPKRIKRILANRQSAQRSRVRKLQYVSELERSVTTLQAEISVLSPRVAYLDHQRLILGVDNGVLKQRIAALAQDKIFKDAHQEALKREIERLRNVYYQQNLNKKESDEPHIKSQPSHAINGYAEKEQLVI